MAQTNTNKAGKRFLSFGRMNEMKKKRARLGGVDVTFLVVVLILLGVGILMMFSASYAIAINENKVGYYYAIRQVIFGGIGLVAMLIMSFVDYRIFQKGHKKVILKMVRRAYLRATD